MPISFRQLLLCLMILVLPLQSLLALAHASCLPLAEPVTHTATMAQSHHCDEMQNDNATLKPDTSATHTTKAHPKSAGCHQLSPCCSALAFLTSPVTALPQAPAGFVPLLLVEQAQSVTLSVPVPPPRRG